LRHAIRNFDQLQGRSDDPSYDRFMEGRAAARLDLANALRLQGKDEERAQTYRQLIEQYDELARLHPGLPHYRETLALTQVDLASLLHKCGNQAQARELAEESLRTLLDLRRGYPTFMRYQLGEAGSELVYGLVLGHLGQNAEAEQALRLAVENLHQLAESGQPISDRLIGARRSLGRLLHKSGQLDSALAEYAHALQCVPAVPQGGSLAPDALEELAWLHLYRGDVLHDHGRSQDASVAYQESLVTFQKLRPAPERLVEQALLLANCRWNEFRRPAEGVALAKKAIELVDDNPRYWRALGIACFRAGEFDESCRALRKACELQDEPQGLELYFLSMACRQRGELEQAAGYFQQANEAAAGSPGDWDLAQVKNEAQQLAETGPETSPNR
jgi:tetratricopeptide (TPR) repeat protein